MRLSVSAVRSVPCMSILSLAIAALLCTSLPAEAANVTDPFFSISVDTGGTPETYDVPLSEVTHFGDIWTWSGGGEDLTYATLQSANLFVQGGPDSFLLAPGFTLYAHDEAINVTITTTILSFDALDDVFGSGSFAPSLTDNNSDGAEMTPLGGAGMYAAYYNIPPGTLFAELGPGLVADPDQTAVGEWETGSVPFGETVTSMQLQFSFTLTAQDSVSGTFNYVIAPEPASLLLLAVGGLALGRRARR